VISAKRKVAEPPETRHESVSRGGIGTIASRQVGVSHLLHLSLITSYFALFARGLTIRVEQNRGLVVKQQIGLVVQFLVLTATPLISWWQLQFGFNLIWMPGLLTVAAVLFWIGTRLRESK
jgi:hypothetical protein